MRATAARLGVAAAISVTPVVGACTGALGDEVAALKQQVAQLDQSRAELDEARRAQQALLDAATARVDALEKQVAAVESDNVSLRQQTASLEQQVAGLEARADELDLKITELKSHKRLTIGVPECDDYIARYSRCIEDKLPERMREASRRALATSVDAWRKAAKSEAEREGLALACKTAIEMAADICGF